MSFTDFEASYRPGGRPPYAPRAMIGIILYGILQGLSSLRDLACALRVNAWLGPTWVAGG